MFFRMPTIAGFFGQINFSVKHFGQKSSEVWKEEPGTEWIYTASNLLRPSESCRCRQASRPPLR
jgi:hypothetical protein